MTIEELIARVENGGEFHVPPELMPDYIRWQYSRHRCLSEFFGVTVEAVARGSITVGMDLKEDYTNSGGFLYGGILAAMADAMSLGLIVGVGKSAVTTNLAMNFVKASPVSGRVHLAGTLRHNGGRMLTLAGEVRDDRGALLADIQITMMVVGNLPEVPERW